jgi:hypothetical protein
MNSKNTVPEFRGCMFEIQSHSIPDSDCKNQRAKPDLLEFMHKKNFRPVICKHHYGILQRVLKARDLKI